MRVILLALAGSLFAHGQGDLSKLAFMSGCWVGPGTEEVWLKPAGESVLGMGRTIRNGKTVSTEFFVVTADPQGKLALHVQLELAEKVTIFPVVEISAKHVVFENPQHDFPQRIIYRMKGDGSLTGRIEGRLQGKEKSQDYPMTRSSCN